MENPLETSGLCAGVTALGKVIGYAFAPAFGGKLFKDSRALEENFSPNPCPTPLASNESPCHKPEKDWVDKQQNGAVSQT